MDLLANVNVPENAKTGTQRTVNVPENAKMGT